MIFKLKIPKAIKEKVVLLREGEYLIVKSHQGDTLVLTKPKEPPLKERAILEIVGIGKSGLKDISSNHDDYLYPAKKKNEKNSLC